MGVILRVTSGPSQGTDFAFERHDTFIVGRKDAHCEIPDDGFLSRHHFLVEVDPPRCLLRDLGSRNGTRVNGQRATEIHLHDGDVVEAGHTTFHVQIEATYLEIPRLICVRCQRAVAPDDIIGAIRADEERLRWVCDACKAHARQYPRPPRGYWIERRIGDGGMGEVYLAHSEADRRPVAIKMMIPTVATGEKARLYFQRELEVLRNLRHPNIVAFYDMIEQDGQFQLIMEYVDGSNARAWVESLRPKALSISTGTWIGMQLLSALDHAHQKGYVHRDIKPSNLLISGPLPWPDLKLSDFGLAKSFRDNAGFTGLTHQGDIGGSVGFISPDQIRDFREVKEPADIYSTGATLYFLLTGQYPFLHFDPKKGNAYAMILEHPTVPLRAHRPDAPEGLERVLRKSLEKQPKDRWQSAAAMALALRPFLQEPPG